MGINGHFHAVHILCIYYTQLLYTALLYRDQLKVAIFHTQLMGLSGSETHKTSSTEESIDKKYNHSLS